MKIEISPVKHSQYMKHTYAAYSGRMLFTAFIISLLPLVCRGDGKGDVIATSFFKDLYPSVSFKELKENPDKYCGAMVSVNGFVAPDYDWFDADYVPALYAKPLGIKEMPTSGAQIIKIDIFYRLAFRELGAFQKCKIFGIWYKHNSDLITGKFIRIDRVEAENGKILDMQFVIMPKQKNK